MIKVCHISSAHSSKDIRIFIKECTSLANAGFDVSFVVPTEKSELVNNVNIIAVEKNGNGRLKRMTKTVWKVYKKAKSLNADIYHFHDPELLSIALLLKSKNNRVIFDAHEDVSKQILEKYWINRYLRKFVSSLYKMVENFITKRLDGIVAATPYITTRFTGINKNVININNYPLLNELSNNTEWKSKKNEICYIGGVSEIRGCKEIIEAMGFLNNVKLNIAGNYSPDNFKDELSKINGWNNVIEHGVVGRSEVAEILKKSKAGLVTFYGVPNHIDAQPNKMFEYMSAGVPVIGSNFPFWEEIILGNNCGICVNPENPKEISQAIKFIIDNDDKAQEMGNNGRKAVIEKYNWGGEEKKLLDFYKNLIT